MQGQRHREQVGKEIREKSIRNEVSGSDVSHTTTFKTSEDEALHGEGRKTDKELPSSTTKHYSVQVRNLRDGYRSRQQELQRVKEEQKRFIQEIKRTHVQEMALGENQKEGGKASDEERRQLAKEARKARCEWRTRLLEEQRVRVEQKKLDEDMKKWREEETLRRGMEDKTKMTDSEILTLDHQRRQVEEIIKISEQIVRNTETLLTSEDVGTFGRSISELENSENADEKEHKEMRDKTKTRRDGIVNQTDSEDDEDWHVLAKLKREQTKKGLPLLTETGDFEHVTSITVPDYNIAKIPEEFCITQILEPKQEADKRRAARVEKTMKEKDKRSINLDNQIYKLVSQSTKMPTNMNSEMRKILEKVRATAAREGDLMEELLQSKESSESGKQRYGSSATRTRRCERPGRGQKLRSWNDDVSLCYLLNKLGSNKRYETRATVKSPSKDEPRKGKEMPLSFQWSSNKSEGRPRHALHSIPFVKHNIGTGIQSSTSKSKYILKR